jgi:hypothetical protein
MTNRTNTLLIVLGVVVLLSAGWLFYQQSDSATALSAQSGPQSGAEQTFISLAQQLDPISFPTAIFSDPRFTMLSDTRTPLTPEAAGRTDPFAPLGAAK